MAKNKNRKQPAGPPNRAARPEHAHEQAQQDMAEEQQAAGPRIPGSPAHAARKQQKRFGHN
ncbi:hypothetical protein [Streptomyces sp. NPDC047000]|uniref:hypothetical protein n=1 Tax=Streptomyces sp. NPDC047000 TaxID=3155474 RepID=UPI0033E3227F